MMLVTAAVLFLSSAPKLTHQKSVSQKKQKITPRNECFSSTQRPFSARYPDLAASMLLLLFWNEIKERERERENVPVCIADTHTHTHTLHSPLHNYWQEWNMNVCVCVCVCSSSSSESCQSASTSHTL